MARQYVVSGLYINEATDDEFVLSGIYLNETSGGALVTVYPVSDVSVGTWTTQAGGTTNLYAVIDEVVADDADYAKSANLTTTQTDTLEVALGSVNDPASAADHVIAYRYRAQGVATMNLTVSLRQGAGTQIASWTHNSVGTSFVNGSQTLSESEANAITNYADLRLRFVATAA